MALNFGGFVSGIGAGVNDLFQAEADKAQQKGDYAAAGSYGYAAFLEEQNKGLSQLSTKIQTAQLNRKINQTIGAEKATAGAANVSPGGSFGDIMRDSLNQGALARTLVQTQGAIEANAYEAQATGYRAMAASAQAAGDAAGAAAKGAGIAAIFQFGGAGLGLLAGL